MSIASVHSALNQTIGNLSSRFSENRTVRNINEGLINLVPIVLIGTICTAISNLPIPALHDFLNDLTAEHWSLVSHIITFATADVVGLAALMSVSYSLAESSRFVQRREISVFIPLFTAFSCYIILFSWDSTTYNLAVTGATPELLVRDPGRTGVFFALFVALVAIRLFSVYGRLWQRISGSNRRAIDSTYQIRTAMRSVFPVLCTLLSFVVLRLFIGWVAEETVLVRNLEGFLQRLITSGDFFSVLATVICMQLLWFVGAHGSDTMLTFLPNTDTVTQNLTGAAAASGAGGAAVADLHNTFASQDFYTSFVSLGGAGTTMSLLIALLIFGSASKGKKLARVSVFPMVFNINETLLYGLPIVLNPFMLVPFLLAPMLVAALSYAAFASGLVPPIIDTVDWTTPILLSGYMETGSIAGLVLQLASLAMAFAIYAPFVRITKDATRARQLEIFDRFKRLAAQAANSEQISLISRHDNIGGIARDLISEFNTYFTVNNIPFYMVYQPKTDKDGRVAGCEALLRWQHPTYGMVPPDVLIELTDEAELSTAMGRWITRTSLEQFAKWRQQGMDEMALSINLNPRHIFEDHDFPEYLLALITKLGLDPQFIEMEITEHVAVRSDEQMLAMFARIRDTSVGLSIDDMGMGYSSLTYISDFGVGTVKLDISLVDKVTINVQQQEIVRSVVKLATQLCLVVIVEGVETKEQLDALVELGCRYYQGYYFSKPLKPADFEEYVSRQGTTKMLPLC